MDSVDIVMATYNGEKYLEAQIDSILAQDHWNWKLYISDDGSVDSTCAILNKYAETNSRLVIVNTERQGGVVKNFDKALTYSTSKYVMLCDQDDIWLTNKISLMLDAIKKIELKCASKKPALVFSDLCLIDEDNNTTQESFYKSNKLNPTYNIEAKFLSWRSSVYGCTIIVNRELLLRALPLPPEVPMHDQWLCLIAAYTGSIAYVNVQTIRYRQHESNVVGGVGRGSWGKVKSFRHLLRNVEKAVECCIQQNSILPAYLSMSESKQYFNLMTTSGKLKFLTINVLPYWKERMGYCFFFVVKMFSRN